ncbi:hypothetical protein [Corynebacterium riegelii]
MSSVTPVNEFNENVRLMEQDFESYADKFLKKPRLQDYLPRHSFLDVWMDKIFGVA